MTNDKKTVLKEIEMLRNNKEAVCFQTTNSLKDSGESVVLILIDILRNTDDESVQTATAVALESLGEFAKDSIPELTKLLYSENEETRVFSARSLSRMGFDVLPYLEEVIKNENSSAKFWASWVFTLVNPRNVDKEIISTLINARESTESLYEHLAVEEALEKITNKNIILM